jgi:hypothetical protein
MKKNYLFILLIIIESQVIAGETTYHSMVKKDESKHVIAAMSQKAAAQDIHGLIDALPELELLWKQEPLAYLEAVKVSVQALITSSDPEAIKAALDLFPSIINKTCPPDTEAASIYFSLKYNIIRNCFNLIEVRENQQRFLVSADFLSEVRSQRIPDYRSRVIQHPGREILKAAKVYDVDDLPTEAHKEAYIKAIAQNKEEQNMQSLQHILSSMDRTFTDTLIESGQRLPLPKAEKQEFHRELAKRAKLTAEEQKKLEANP